MSKREQLDLDAIEALIIEFSYSGALRRPYVERVNLAVEIAKSAPVLVAELRASRARVAELDLYNAGLELNLKLRVEEMAELEIENKRLDNRIGKWERWEPTIETLREMKEQARRGPNGERSLAAECAYIGHLEYHHRKMSARIAELETLLANVIFEYGDDDNNLLDALVESLSA